MMGIGFDMTHAARHNSRGAEGVKLVLRENPSPSVRIPNCRLIDSVKYLVDGVMILV